MESNRFIQSYTSHLEAESAIRTMQHAGFDLQQLSIVGQGYHLEEYPVGFYGLPDRMKAWGRIGMLAGLLWGLVMAPMVLTLPVLDYFGATHPLVVLAFGAIEGAMLVGGLCVFGAVLTQWGLPSTQKLKYKTAIQSDTYVLMIYGTQIEASRAQELLKASLPERYHQPTVVTSAHRA